MDALNQIPNYLIRGENWAAIGNLFDAYQRMVAISRGQGQSYFDWNEYKHASFQTVKAAYESQAPRHKLPFFTEFQTDRVIVATRLYYNVLFGHFGDGVVSGFKENRFVCGTRFHSLKCPEEFTAFMLFLRKLCLRVRVLLLSRGTHDPQGNVDLLDSVPLSLRHKADADLQHTHEVYDDYAQANPDDTLRIRMEEMFDPQRNASTARKLLSFLGEDPSLPIRFTRMPAH